MALTKVILSLATKEEMVVHLRVKVFHNGDSLILKYADIVAHRSGPSHLSCLLYYKGFQEELF